MSIFNIISLLGGLGMFLFGMNLMSDGLEKTAGDRMNTIIESLTGNVFKGVLAGALVTALIQSSSATTVMVIGFVNAGIMRLTQAVGVIMGANIGTTVTAQLLSLSDIGGGAWYLSLLKPANFAPILVALGAFMIIFSKRKALNNVGSILTGFGILFIGMGAMESSVSVLQDLPQFQEIFATLTNPVLGVLVGAAVTAIIQSSSASVGILQAAASTGQVTFSAAVPIILGQNIGTCVTALLSSVGANKNAKRAAVIHLAFNVIGTIVFLLAIYGIQTFIGFHFWNDNITRNGIANIHLIFNVVNTLLLLPFNKLLVTLANTLIRDRDYTSSETTLLDDRFLTTPPLAITQAVRETMNMALVAEESLALVEKAILNRDISKHGKIDDNENAIDLFESNITRYLMRITDEPLGDYDNKLASSLYHVLIDLERIGDHCSNLFKITTHMVRDEIKFSPSAQQEIKVMLTAIREVLHIAIECYANESLELAHRVIAYESAVDKLRQSLRIHHIERLSKQKCSIDSAIIFLDMIGNLERISDHCANIAAAVEQLLTEKPNFDLHKDPKAFRYENPAEYQKLFDEFTAKYSVEEI